MLLHKVQKSLFVERERTLPPLFSNSKTSSSTMASFRLSGVLWLSRKIFFFFLAMEMPARRSNYSLLSQVDDDQFGGRPSAGGLRSTNRLRRWERIRTTRRRSIEGLITNKKFTWKNDNNQLNNIKKMTSKYSFHDINSNLWVMKDV